MEVEITSYYFYHISNPKPYNCGNHLSLIIFEYGQYWNLILLLQKKKKKKACVTMRGYTEDAKSGVCPVRDPRVDTVQESS